MYISRGTIFLQQSVSPNVCLRMMREYRGCVRVRARENEGSKMKIKRKQFNSAHERLNLDRDKVKIKKERVKIALERIRVREQKVKAREEKVTMREQKIKSMGK